MNSAVPVMTRIIDSDTRIRASTITMNTIPASIKIVTIIAKAQRIGLKAENLPQ